MKDYSNHIINIKSTLRDALQRLNELSSTLTLILFVIDKDEKLVGSITDGDIRRSLLSGIELTQTLDCVVHKDYASLYKADISLAYIKQLRAENKMIVPLLDEEGRIVEVYDFNKRKTILPIDAVLMAGGRGERLRPLTDKTPKPLLPVGDKPIIDHNVDNLTRCGVDTFFVTVNYLKEQLVNHFADSKLDRGIDVTCVSEPKPLGTMGSLTLVEGMKHNNVLVMNSDLFTNIDYEDFYENFMDENADMSVATIPYNVDIPYAIMDLDGDNVKAFQEKPSLTYYANAGIYLIKRELLNLIPLDKRYDATDFMQDLIDAGKSIIRYPIVGYWVDIGKPQDYTKVQEFVKHLGR